MARNYNFSKLRNHFILDLPPFPECLEKPRRAFVSHRISQHKAYTSPLACNESAVSRTMSMCSCSGTKGPCLCEKCLQSKWMPALKKSSTQVLIQTSKAANPQHAPCFAFGLSQQLTACGAMLGPRTPRPMSRDSSQKPARTKLLLRRKCSLSSGGKDFQRCGCELCRTISCQSQRSHPGALCLPLHTCSPQIPLGITINSVKRRYL